MTIERMDHVGVVVDDLAAAIEFFGALGWMRRAALTIDEQTCFRPATRVSPD